MLLSPLSLACGWLFVCLPDTTLDPPLFTSTPVTSVVEDEDYHYVVTASDEEGDPFAINVITLPSWLTAVHDSSGTSVSLSGTPTQQDVGSISFVELHVVDQADEDRYSVQAFYIDVIPFNDPPVFTSTPPDPIITEFDLYTYTPTATDEEGADVVITVLGELPPFITFEDGVLSGIPHVEDRGEYAWTLVAADDVHQVTQSVTLTVVEFNDPPVFASTPVTNATEDVLYSYYVTADDDEGGDIVFSAPELPHWLSFDPVTHILSGSPEQRDVGMPNQVTLRISDGDNDVFQSFAISVAFVNDPPEFRVPFETTATEDHFFSYEIEVFDEEGDPVTAEAQGIPSWTTFDPETRIISGTPSVEDIGDHNFTVSISDGQLEVSSVFHIEVLEFNDNPFFTSVPDTLVVAGDPYQYTVTAYDEEGAPITFGDPALPSWLILENGVLQGVPADEHIGFHLVTLLASDGVKGAMQTFDIQVGMRTDETPPRPGTIDSIDYSIVDEVLHLSWSGYEDDESGIADYEISVGSRIGEADVIGSTKLNGRVVSCSLPLNRTNLNTGRNYWVMLAAHNGAGLETQTTPVDVPLVTADTYSVSNDTTSGFQVINNVTQLSFRLTSLSLQVLQSGTFAYRVITSKEHTEDPDTYPDPKVVYPPRTFFDGVKFVLTLMESPDGATFEEPMMVEVDMSTLNRQTGQRTELYVYNLDSQAWMEAPSTCLEAEASTLDEAAGILTVPVCHLSYFALFTGHEVPTPSPSPTDLREGVLSDSVIAGIAVGSVLALLVSAYVVYRNKKFSPQGPEGVQQQREREEERRQRTKENEVREGRERQRLVSGVMSLFGVGPSPPSAAPDRTSSAVHLLTDEHDMDAMAGVDTPHEDAKPEPKPPHPQVPGPKKPTAPPRLLEKWSGKIPEKPKTVEEQKQEERIEREERLQRIESTIHFKRQQSQRSLEQPPEQHSIDVPMQSLDGTSDVYADRSETGQDERTVGEPAPPPPRSRSFFQKIRDIVNPPPDAYAKPQAPPVKVYEPQGIERDPEFGSKTDQEIMGYGRYNWQTLEPEEDPREDPRLAAWDGSRLDQQNATYWERPQDKQQAPKKPWKVKRPSRARTAEDVTVEVLAPAPRFPRSGVDNGHTGHGGGENGAASTRRDTLARRRQEVLGGRVLSGSTEPHDFEMGELHEE